MGECNTRVELYVKSRLFVYAFVKATVLLFLSFSSQWTNRYFRAFGGVMDCKSQLLPPVGFCFAVDSTRLRGN